MTTPIEALERALSFVETESGEGSESEVAVMIRSALASLEGDAVERVARIIDPGVFTALDRSVVPVAPEEKTFMEAARAKARVILATGLAGEAAIRAAHIKVLRGLLYSCAEQANVTGPDKTTGRHMINLIDTIERSPDMPVDKIARWTGFIQGVLAARGLLDVDEERNRTRPIFAAAIRSGGGE